MRPFSETKLLWKNFVSSITSSSSGSRRKEHPRSLCGMDDDDDVICTEVPMGPGACGGEAKAAFGVEGSKYDVNLLGDEEGLEDVSMELGEQEATPENLAAVVAECNRLRMENRRLHVTLYNLDAQMDEVVANCEKVVADSNFRFKKAINSLMHMDTSLRALKKESSLQARQLEDVTSERNVLRRRLDSALNELKNLRTCSLSWVRSGSSKVARVQEGLSPPRRTR